MKICRGSSWVRALQWSLIVLIDYPFWQGKIVSTKVASLVLRQDFHQLVKYILERANSEVDLGVTFDSGLDF